MVQKQRFTKWGRWGFVLLAVVLVATFWFLSKPTYLHIIKLNWEVDLPTGCEQLYEQDTGPSFHGDGLRYHVFAYRRAPKLEGDWLAAPLAEADRQEVERILSKLQVDGADAPAFERVTHTLTRRQRDNSTLYMLYAADNQRLFVIEHFI